MVAHATEFPEELTSQQRAAIIVYHLGVLGRRYTTAEIAELVGLGYWGALILMDKLSGVEGLPITKLDGKWMMLPGG